MTADLTLPGTIPGLLRRGSPIILDDGRFGRPPGIVLHVWAPGTGSEVAERADIGWPDSLGNAAPATVSRMPLHRLLLDLTDATGRAHAAWWLADRYGRDHDEIPVAGPLHRGSGEWVMYAPTSARADDWLRFAPKSVPSLADLDPADHRLLPDGSRWVDAEALRRVVLHIAGVP